MMSKSHGGVKHAKHSSTKVHNEAGSGSRPGGSRHKVETSAPKHPHHLDGRRVPGALK